MLFVFATCAEAIMYFLLNTLRDCTFKYSFTTYKETAIQKCGLFQLGFLDYLPLCFLKIRSSCSEK